MLFDPKKFTTGQFLSALRALDEELRPIERDHGLHEVVRLLCEQQFHQGFVGFHSATSIRRKIVDPHDRCQWYLVQYNEARARRFGGAGRPQPPRGWAVVNDRCFLCIENQCWQHGGRELGYAVSVLDEGYGIFTNPFPLGENHVTIATTAHVPQRWSSSHSLQSIIEHLVVLAERLPGFVVFYNGPSAGASLPAHRHFQALGRPLEFYPLEARARRQAAGGPVVVSNYPITAVYQCAMKATVVDDTTRLLSEWLDDASKPRSVNLIAVGDDRPGWVHLLTIPRHTALTHAPGLAGGPAALELLGELVLSTEDEGRRLVEGEIDYAFVERVLTAVDDPQFAKYLVEGQGLRAA